MYWNDEGYLLSKNNYNENSLIVETFTLNHGKHSAIVYGGSSRKLKKYFQIGNKVSINWKSKGENKIGYYNIELIKPISPSFFHDKKKTIGIVAASSILKTLLPDSQINKKIYQSFEYLLNSLNNINWINLYIFWELSLVKELGFEIDFKRKVETSNTININGEIFKIPNLILNKNSNITSNTEIIKALNFNKNLLLKNFILPNSLKLPLSRNILEKYYN